MCVNCVFVGVRIFVVIKIGIFSLGVFVCFYFVVFFYVVFE